MRILLLASDDCNQWALAHRLTTIGNLVGIVFSENQVDVSVGEQRTWQALHRLTCAPFNWPFRKAWFQLMDSYRSEFDAAPNAVKWHVEEVNDELTSAVITKTVPDVVLVSGTNLLKKPLIDHANGLSRFGTMNLHTGLSPFIRGGPNCTNWCLATRRPWMIGNTVMWINEGIDSGEVLATEGTPIDGGESLLQLHRRVMDHAHDLTCRTIKAVECGAVIPRPQGSFSASGDLYLTRDWRPAQMLRAMTYLQTQYRLDVSSNAFNEHREGLELVRLREVS